MLEPQQTDSAPPDARTAQGEERAPAAPQPQVGPLPPAFPDESHDLSDLLGMYEDEEQPVKTGRRRWWVIGASGLVAVALIGGVVTVVHAHNTKPPTTYNTATLAQGNLAQTVSGTGPVQAALYNLNFATSGKVAEIDVKVGQQVKAGQVLAKLDATSLQNALYQAQLQANNAYYQEQQAINNCNTAKSPPPDCVQLAQNQYAMSLQQLQTAKDNLSSATLTASHAGIVTAINGTVGATASSGGSGGSSSSSGFIQVVDPNSLQVAATVNETDIAGVKVGQLATFTVSAYAGKVFHATVSSISQIGQSSSGVVSYPVTLQVDTSRLLGASLYTGMTANVTIVKAQRVNVTLVPVSAVTFARAAAITSSGGFLSRTQVSDALTQARQQITTLEQQNPQITQDTPTAAWALERSGGKWVVKPIVIGLSNGTYYEVLSGLNPGETVVTGEVNGTITTTTSSSAGAGGGRFGGGGFGGGGFGGGGFGGGRGGAGGNGN